jgi:hypothetical protein
MKASTSELRAKRIRRSIRIILLGLALAPIIYVGLYFVLVDLPPGFQIPWTPFSTQRGGAIAMNGEWKRFPDYRGLPRWLFAPIHDYDRIHLRPNKWGGTYSKAKELSFDWLLGKGNFEDDFQ